MNTSVTVIPSGLELPAHLQSADIAAQIAEINAAAAGGIKAGGFPQISIKSNQFHIKEGGELNTLKNPPAAPGQPALPMMCLELVVVAANPALSKTYYPGEWVEGSVEEPKCRSSNGVTPDADVIEKQSAACGNCPQNQWGSKVSKISGKDIKACGDSKQLAVLPAGDLTYKMLGLRIGGGSLKNWGQYINALSGRGYPIFGLVTNVTFDATQNGVLNFSFNRFLNADESAKVKERSTGGDVQVIVAQSRVIAAPALAAPPVVPTLTAPVQPAAPVPTTQPQAAPVATEPVAPVAAAPQVGFGATSTPAPAPAEPPKRTRRTRAQIEADNAAKGAAPTTMPPPGMQFTESSTAAVAPIPATVTQDLSHLPPAILTAVQQLGVDSPAGQALLAQFPRPATVQPAAVQVPSQKGTDETGGAVNPAPAAAPTVGFGTQAPAPAAQPTAQVIAAGESLKDRLAKILQVGSKAA